MLYTLLVLFLFLLMASSAFLKLENKTRVLLFSLCCLFCISIAGFRPIGVDQDSANYLDVFNDNADGILVERSFHVISSLVKFLCGSDILFVLLIYAIIGVTAKFVAIKQLTNLWMLSCAIYISNIYIVQDITQIRVGVATGMLLLCIKPLYERNWKYFLLFSSIGAIFHIAALFIFPLWFIKPKSFNKTRYATLIFISYCIFFMGFTVTELINLIPLDYVQEKLRMNYEAAVVKGEMVTPFTILQSLRLFVATIVFWKLERIAVANKYVYLLLKIYVFGIASFVLFTDIPAFSLRITEFLVCVEVILIPLLIYAFKNEKVGICVPMSIGVFLIIMNLFIFKLVC